MYVYVSVYLIALLFMDKYSMYCSMCMYTRKGQATEVHVFDPFMTKIIKSLNVSHERVQSFIIGYTNPISCTGTGNILFLLLSLTVV